MTKKLFESTNVGSIEVKNRIFMAPLTRNRADNDTDILPDISIEYYRQRASAGLIITEATQVSEMGKGYFAAPGIYTDEQTAQWKKIVDAVHAEGGKIILQLWHVGRISHSSLLPNNAKPHAPSALKANAQTFTTEGFTDCSEPAEMTEADIQKTISDYKHAVENCVKAGFDGVEVHGANGYLINQFLSDYTNKRTDKYGGSIENRSRFFFEILDAVTKVMPSDKVGVRLSPTGDKNDMATANPIEDYSYILQKMNGHSLAYVHFVEKFSRTDVDNHNEYVLMKVLENWNGFYLANGDYNRTDAINCIESGYADAVAFGRDFISNPDLPKRLEIGAPLNEGNQQTYYGGGAEGYIDYPFLKQA